MKQQICFTKVVYFIAIIVAGLAMTVALVGCGSDKVSSEDDQIRALQAQLALLQTQAIQRDSDFVVQAQDIADLSALIANLQASLIALSGTDLALAADISGLQMQLDAMQLDLNSLNTQQMATQTALNGALVQLATLEGYTNIISIEDPCGDTPGKIDEVFLQLNTGQLLASFSDNAAGANTRFSVLPDGNYSTTDGTNCAVHIANGVATW